MRRRCLSIRWKMTLLYTSLVTVLLVALGLFLFFSVEQLIISSFDEALNFHFKQALNAAPRLVTELAEQGHRKDSVQLSTLESLSGPGLFLQICNKQGYVLAVSSNLGKTTLPFPSGVVTPPGQIQEEQIRLPVVGLLPEAAHKDIKQARFLMKSSYLVDAQGKVVGILEEAQSLFTVDEVQDGLIDVLGEGIVVAIVLAITTGLWLAGRLLRPIAHITHMAQRIGKSGDLSQRIERSERLPRDEVGTLAATFNTMLEQLDSAFKAQRQFVADASHELKTPLTAIMGHANFLRRHGKRASDTTEEATDAIIDQAERMHRLILDMLYLARTGNGRYLAYEEISMTDLVREVIKELALLGKERGVIIQISSTVEEKVCIPGDRNMVKRLILNLVENAIKFTTAGGRVEVTAGLEDNGERQQAAYLKVQDTGCGIASEDVPYIFERFYRADKARTRAEGGSGLGLAIAREIARLHGGDITVESQPGRGSAFLVHLPVLNEEMRNENLSFFSSNSHLHLTLDK